MARPNNIGQVKDRYNVIATVDMTELLTKPGLLKAYTAMVEAAEKLGGGAVTKWTNTVEVRVGKNGKQLADQLESEQRTWDNNQERYQKAVDGEYIESYMRSYVKDFADAEGLEVPEFVEQEEVVEV